MSSKVKDYKINPVNIDQLSKAMKDQNKWKSWSLLGHLSMAGHLFNTKCRDHFVYIYMCPANERRRYDVRSSLIGWVHTQNNPYKWFQLLAKLMPTVSCYLHWKLEMSDD